MVTASELWVNLNSDDTMLDYGLESRVVLHEGSNHTRRGVFHTGRTV